MSSSKGDEKRVKKTWSQKAKGSIFYGTTNRAKDRYGK